MVSLTERLVTWPLKHASAQRAGKRKDVSDLDTVSSLLFKGSEVSLAITAIQASEPIIQDEGDRHSRFAMVSEWYLHW